MVDITNQLFSLAKEKMDIVNAAVNAAAAAERPNLRMNGTEGLDSNLAGVDPGSTNPVHHGCKGAKDQDISG